MGIRWFGFILLGDKYSSVGYSESWVCWFNRFNSGLSADFRFVVGFCVKWYIDGDDSHPHRAGRPHAAKGVARLYRVC